MDGIDPALIQVPEGSARLTFHGESVAKGQQKVSGTIFAELRSNNRTVDHSLAGFAQRTALVGQREFQDSIQTGDQQHRVRDSAVNQFDKAFAARGGAQLKLKNGNLDILTLCIEVCGNANGRRLERRGPLQLLDAFPDTAPVPRRKCAVLDKQRLGNTAVDVCIGRECERRDRIERLGPYKD